MNFRHRIRRAAGSSQNTNAFIAEKVYGLPAGSSLSPQDKAPSFGATPIIKAFYEGKGSVEGHINWVEDPPKQLKEKVAKAHDRVAIKLYKVADPEKPTVTGRTPLKIHSIDLQSPLLVTALKPIVQEVGMFLDEQDTAKFTEPFKPLFFCYDKIITLQDQSNKDPVFRDHLELLTQLMEELFGRMRTQLRNLQQSRLVSFKLAWTYFPKGSNLFCGAEDCDRLFRVLDTQYLCDGEGARLSILCEYIVFTGETFEWETTSLKVPAFGGNIPVDSLPHYPLDFHPNVESLKSKLTARGQKVLDYQGLEYREYTGTGMTDKCEKHNVSSFNNSALFKGSWSNSVHV